MTARYVAVIAMYTAAAVATVGSAWAWGPEGRVASVVVSLIAFLWAAVGAIQLDRPPTPPTKTPGA